MHSTPACRTVPNVPAQPHSCRYPAAVVGKQRVSTSAPRVLIHSIQSVDTLARNKSEMAVISGSNVDFDDLADVSEQER